MRMNMVEWRDDRAGCVHVEALVLIRCGEDCASTRPGESIPDYQCSTVFIHNVLCLRLL